MRGGVKISRGGLGILKNVKDNVKLTKMQGKFDVYKILCCNKFTRRKESKKFTFEQRKISFCFKMKT